METEWQESFDQELAESYPESWDWNESEGEYFPESRWRRRAAARRFLPSRTFIPSRSVGRPVPATMNAVRALQERQRSTAAQLAGIQQRATIQQSSETFGPILTSAAAAITLGIKEKNVFNPLLTHGVPLSQLLLLSRGRSVGAAFRANPWATVAFPVGAVLVGAFGRKLLGLEVGDPEVTPIPGSGGAGGTKPALWVKVARGVTVHFETNPTLPVPEPTASSKPVPPGGLLSNLTSGHLYRFVAVKGNSKSNVTDPIAVP